ncbi:hypothetical protein JKP88DRAFT_242995 [Tribonema minus]|uniref:Uncharacterized protein n=1 Tax=Tribonema minus TaxID=303371 RepID=A0A836CKV1_9STRA|nr:hypothetical protein JKP88DRAFT_242995 [Tribonema minus]
MTCLEHRRVYASAWNGAKLLLTEFDARDATGQRVITRTPLFKSLLEDMLQRGPAAAAAAPGEAAAAAAAAADGLPAAAAPPHAETGPQAMLRRMATAPPEAAPPPAASPPPLSTSAPPSFDFTLPWQLEPAAAARGAPQVLAHPQPLRPVYDPFEHELGDAAAAAAAAPPAPAGGQPRSSDGAQASNGGSSSGSSGFASAMGNMASFEGPFFFQHMAQVRVSSSGGARPAALQQRGDGECGGGSSGSAQAAADAQLDDPELLQHLAGLPR